MYKTLIREAVVSPWQIFGQYPLLIPLNSPEYTQSEDTAFYSITFLSPGMFHCSHLRYATPQKSDVKNLKNNPLIFKEQSIQKKL